MATLNPRVVFVTRESEYELLMARHGTREQAGFFLQSRGQHLDAVEARHLRLSVALKICRTAIRDDWRQALLKRTDFDRFLFGPEDIIVAVGQDGLVANIAKYLKGQPVYGVNPDPQSYDGVLTCFSPAMFADAISSGSAQFEARTMVMASLDDGAKLIALNEIFVGHRSHQSARYDIKVDDDQEFHSSSGLIVTSGTGATGWARSIMEATQTKFSLAPCDARLGLFVREPFPSIATGTAISARQIERKHAVTVTSRMNEGGIIFADGIEKDHLLFDWGRIASISVADQHLNLAIGA